MRVMSDGVTVYRSPRSAISHTTLECAALDVMRDAGRDPADYLDPYPGRSLAEVFDPGAHPRTLACRVCAIGPLLEEVLPALLAVPGDPVLVVTGLRSPQPSGRHDAADQVLTRRRRAPLRPQDRAVRLDAAAQRATRVASATGMSFTLSSHGPVLYGFMAERAVDALAALVEVDTLPADGPVRPEHVATYWSLRRGSDMDTDTAWTVAAGVLA